MIPKFRKEIYTTALAALGVAEAVMKALSTCFDQAHVGFEASSRSVTMLCHSIKMGIAMKVGSKLENAGRLTFEINPLIAAFYFKVGELVISFLNEEGKKCSIRHRPDALRLFELPEQARSGVFKTEEYIRFAEFKSWEVVEAASQKGDRYIFDKATGRFRCPSAEQVAAEMFGFGYDVITERDLDPVIVANVELLSAYFDEKAKKVSVELTDRARHATATKQGIALAELMASIPGLTKDNFFKLLADQKLYVPLEICHLDMPQTVQVFTDRLSFEAFAALTPRKLPGKMSVRSRFPIFEPGELITIRGSNYEVVAPSKDTVQFRNDRGDSSVMTRQDLERLLKDRQISSMGVPIDPADKARKILLGTPPRLLAPALQRLAILQPVLDGKRAAKGIAKRLANGKTWLRRARASALEYGNALIGCIDGRNKQGWRGSHVSEQSEKLITEAIDKEYLTAQAPGQSAAYGAYRNLCKARGCAPVSAKSFHIRIKRYAADKIARARGRPGRCGPRGARIRRNAIGWRRPLVSACGSPR